MARKYSPAAAKSVGAAMKRMKQGKLKSGPGGKAGTVKNPKQTIAIGLSEARKAGKKVPKKPPARKSKPVAKAKTGRSKKIKKQADAGRSAPFPEQPAGYQ